MRIQNTTTFTAAELREVIRFVKPSDVVTAHELRHLWQAQHPKGWRVWGSRGQYSERDADAYAIRMLRAWRRSK